MSAIRVFELAKELNMPAKQLLQKIRAAGVPVTGNFNELSPEQVNQVRNLIQGKSAALKGTRRIRSDGTHRVISSKRAVDHASEGTDEPRVITISAKTQHAEEDDADTRPHRRLRRRRVTVETAPEETEKTEQVAEIIKETPVEAPPPQVEVKPVEAPKKPAESPTLPDVKPDVKVSQPKTPEKPEKPRLVAKPSPEPAEEQKKEEPQQQPDPIKKSVKKHGKVTSPVGWDNTEYYGKPAKRKVSYGKAGGGRGRNLQVDYYSTGEARSSRKRGKMERGRERKGKFPQKLTTAGTAKHIFNPRKKSIKIGNQVTVGELAGLIGIKATDIIRKLMEDGTLATINQSIPGETAALIAAEFDVEVELSTFELEDTIRVQEPDSADLETRAPIVTIMGHVDHGKTSLLDRIRSTHVADAEAGGITQHIGAYHVPAGDQHITFLDTPGHEAFTAMRARGANVTDIVVLIVAADDDVQPQTVEAIHHAQAAEVPIIVAINKIDRPQSNPQKIQQGLLEHELIPEDLGGNTIFVNVSAKTGEGIDALLEMIQLQAEVLELKSTKHGNARGVIIESQVRRGQGNISTVLVQRGTLKIGNHFVAGTTFGRVRSMFNEYGKSKKQAEPSIPVEITGCSQLPEVGVEFVVLEDERTARQIAEERLQKQKEQNVARQQKTNLDNLFQQMQGGEPLELRLLIKADVKGSAEALQSSLEQFHDERITVHVIHSGVGNITETDISLASASDAIMIGFNVQIDAKAKQLRAETGVDVRYYDVIYTALDDIKAAMEGMLEPVIREEIIGHFEVRQVFNSSKNGIIFGGLVTDGRMLRNCLARVKRGGESLFEGKILSLKRFKDDVREVANNYECGMEMEFTAIQIGDIVEAYEKIEETARL